MTNEMYRRNHSLYVVESMMIEKFSTMLQNRPKFFSSEFPRNNETSLLRTPICVVFAQFVTVL